MAYDPKKANPTLIIPEAPAKITRKKKKPKEIAVVIPDNCTGCEACVSFCPVDCIEHVQRDTSDGVNVVIPNVQIRFDECIGCKICVNVCERMAWDAIEMWPADQVEPAEFLLILNRNENIVPGVARLDREQAAAYFMLRSRIDRAISPRTSGAAGPAHRGPSGPGPGVGT